MPDWFRSVDKADVSVIVPLYKSNLVIPDLVKSFSLDEKLKVEIIFIDDHCPKGSANVVLESWIKRRSEIKKPIGKLLYNSQNLGYGLACNAASRFATGDYLIFLNADTVVTQGWIDPLIELFSDKKVGIVGKDAVTVGFQELKQTLKDLRKYPQTLKFLIAYLFYNDGIQTVIAISGTYAILELKLEQLSLVFAIVIVQITALIGSLILGKIAEKYGTKKTILISLIIWTIMVVITYFAPVGQANPYFAIAAGIGFVLGGSQALSRSLYSQVIPRAQEAQYFSFYEISERGTSWLGTFAFGVAFGLTGSYRQSILLIIAFFIVGGLLLVKVNIRQAIKESGNPQPKNI